jgi:hypothetical protein
MTIGPFTITWSSALLLLAGQVFLLAANIRFAVMFRDVNAKLPPGNRIAWWAACNTKGFAVLRLHAGFYPESASRRWMFGLAIAGVALTVLGL